MKQVYRYQKKGKRYYGGWSAGGYPPSPEDKTKCAWECNTGDRMMHYYQCTRKRGYGHKGELCKQHAAKIESLMRVRY